MTISFASPRYGPNDEEFLGSLRDELAICTRYTTGSSEDALRLSACPDSYCRDVAPLTASRSSSPDPPGFSLSRTISVPRPSLRTLYWLKALNRLRA